jgi:hypothetical protein
MTIQKNSIDRRDFWTVFYEVCSAWGMIDDTKKLFRSQRFGIVFYECLFVPWKDLAEGEDTDRRDFGIVFYELYLCLGNDLANDKQTL